MPTRNVVIGPLEQKAIESKKANKALFGHLVCNLEVRASIHDYINNVGSQKAVKAALLAAGLSAEEIKKIDWNKSYFPYQGWLQSR